MCVCVTVISGTFRPLCKKLDSFTNSLKYREEKY